MYLIKVFRRKLNVTKTQINTNIIFNLKYYVRFSQVNVRFHNTFIYIQIV